MISSIAVTVGVLALLVWALAKQGNGGPLMYETSVTLGKARLQGKALAWAMVRSVTTTIGGWAGCVASTQVIFHQRLLTQAFISEQRHSVPVGSAHC